MTRPLIVISAVLTVLALVLTLATATVVAIGFVLNYFVPRIPFEFACIVAGLSILVFTSFMTALGRLVESFSLHESAEDEFDEEEPADLAEQVAEIVSERLEPHFWTPHRAKSRRR